MAVTKQANIKELIQDMEIQELKLSELKPNTGQIPGVPKNPRKWTLKEVADLAASIAEDADLLEARPLLVFQNVVLGGNMRLEAVKSLKYEDVPCLILPETMDAQKLKEIVLKDNTQFGSWDYDELANKWDDLPLQEYGVRGVPEVEQPAEAEGSKELDAEGYDENMVLVFKFSQDEGAFMQRKLDGKDLKTEILRRLNNGVS